MTILPPAESRLEWSPPFRQELPYNEVFPLIDALNRRTGQNWRLPTEREVRAKPFDANDARGTYWLLTNRRGGVIPVWDYITRQWGGLRWYFPAKIRLVRVVGPSRV